MTGVTVSMMLTIRPFHFTATMEDWDSEDVNNFRSVLKILKRPCYYSVYDYRYYWRIIGLLIINKLRGISKYLYYPFLKMFRKQEMNCILMFSKSTITKQFYNTRHIHYVFECNASCMYFHRLMKTQQNTRGSYVQNSWGRILGKAKKCIWKNTFTLIYPA